MLMFLSIVFIFASVLYINHILNIAKERRIEQSTEYAIAKNKWEHMQNWYKEKHPKKAFPCSFLIDTGGWIGTLLDVRSKNGQIEISDTLTPSEFVITVKKIEKYLCNFGYIVK